MPVDMQAVYRKSPSLVHRQIADEVILVPIRRDVADLEAVYALDGVGPRVWELVDGERTVDAILSCIAEEYDVEPSTAQSDVMEFISHLEALAALEKAS